MKKTVLTFTLAASLLALSACNDDTKDNSEVLATSKVGDITQQDLYNEMKASIGEQAFQLLVIEKVLEDKYDVSKEEIEAQLATDKEQMGESFDSIIAQNGYNEETYKQYIKLNLLQEKALIEDVEVSEDDVKAEYDRIKTEINARHILVEDEETAKKVKAELESGKDFAEVAKEYSTEPAAQETGGNLDWISRNDNMDPAFLDAAFALDTNVISDPVQSSFGYHIIEVTEKREIEESYEDKKAEIEKQLKLEKADPSALLSKVAKMMKAADIKIKDEDLKSSLEQFLSAADQPVEESTEEETTEEETTEEGTTEKETTEETEK